MNRSIPLAALALTVSVLATSPVGEAAGRLVLAKNSVGTPQLKAGSVTGPKVKDGTLSIADFKPNSLPTGPKGDQGPQGASGVVDAAFATGHGYNPSSALNRLGVLATVSVPTNGRVHVVATKTLGSIAANANTVATLDAWVCHRPAGSDASGLVTVGEVTRLYLRVSSRIPLTLSAVISGLPAGQHEVGLCGHSPALAYWNDNSASNVTALVLR